MRGLNKMTLKLRLERTKDGKTHRTHLIGHNVTMHLDIVESVIERANRLNVRAELIESIFDNGYVRED